MATTGAGASGAATWSSGGSPVPGPVVGPRASSRASSTAAEAGRRGRRGAGAAGGGRGRGGRRPGRRRRWSRCGRCQPAWAAAARARTMSARMLSAPAATQAAQAASSRSSSTVAGPGGAPAARRARPRLRPGGDEGGRVGVEGLPAADDLGPGRRGRSGLRTSTARPKRSRSWGRRSPSSGFMEPTSRNRAGWLWETPSRSTRFTPEAAASRRASTRWSARRLTSST